MQQRTPIILNSVCKCVAETGATGWVGSDDDVSLVCEDFGIPPGTPGVGPGVLGATVDVEEERVGFALVKARGVYKPGLNLVVSVNSWN